MNEARMNVARWTMCVVVPARNEEALLPVCLDSILRACKALPPGVEWDVVVVADLSTDRTAEIARRLLSRRGTVVRSNAGMVGAARASGVMMALQRYGGRLDRCWIANTDADCRVPENWLADQVTLAEAGIEAVTGTVDVDDFSEHDHMVEQRFRETYLIYPDGRHPHVHGANLGVRADAYVRAEGWSALDTAEDHDLWQRLGQAGCKRTSMANMKVMTSGRRVGRAPQGFAGALAAHNEVLA